MVKNRENHSEKVKKINNHPKTYINEVFSYDETLNDLLSIAYFNLGDYKNAIKNAKLALKINPNNERIKNNLKIFKSIQKKFKNLSKNKTKLIKEIYLILKDIKLNLKKLDLKIDISTTDCILTSYTVFILSNIIAFFIKFTNVKINLKNFKYMINPLYVNQKILNIKLDCIITTNLVHIISILYKNLKKWRCDVNGNETSNR